MFKSALLAPMRLDSEANKPIAVTGSMLKHHHGSDDASQRSLNDIDDTGELKVDSQEWRKRWQSSRAILHKK